MMELQTREISFFGTPFHNAKIRITPDKRYASAIDFISAVSDNKSPRNVWIAVSKRIKQLPDINTDIRSMVSSYSFPGQGQRPTPTINARGIIEMFWLIPGKKVQLFRRNCGSILVRFLGGDKNLIDELCVNNREAENPTTHQAFFSSNISQLETSNNSVKDLTGVDEEICLYTRKLELKFSYKKKELELELVYKRKHDNDAINMIYKRARIELIKLESVKEDVSLRPKRKILIPQLIIIHKNEARGVYKSKIDHLPFMVIRCQTRSVKGTYKSLRERYPNMAVLCHMYNPNPISIFSRFQEEIPIKRHGNHFDLQEVYNNINKKIDAIMSKIRNMATFLPQSKKQLGECLKAIKPKRRTHI
jgi:Protein of unknown function (DUF3627)